MESQEVSHTKTSKVSKKSKDVGIYMKTLINKQVIMSILYVNKDIKNTLEDMIKSEIEGKCIVEGFIKNNSSKIITYSSGSISGANIIFEVVFECLVASPVEGMYIDCIAKNITKAGIRAEIDDSPSPVVIFIARDHHYMSKHFSNIKEGDNIRVKVIGQRFELNDKYISVIAILVEKKKEINKKPRLIISSS